MPELFGRQYRIEIGEGVVLDSRQMRDSQGLLRPLQIRFSVEVSFAAAQSMMELSIYNPNPQLVAQINQGDAISLQAGYPDAFGVIFEGRVSNFHSPREGLDKVLRLYCWSGAKRGRDALLASVSFGPGTPYAEIVDFVATDYFRRSPRYIGFDQGYRQSMGTATDGYSRNDPYQVILNDLARTHGFEWMVQNETVLLFERGKYRPGAPIPITPETGLVGGVSLTWLGADIEAKLDPRVQIGDRVKIEAQTTSLNFSNAYHMNLPKEKTTIGSGVYVVKALQRKGDFYGDNSWTTEMTCWREGEKGLDDGN